MTPERLTELRLAVDRQSSRGLVHSARWTAELAASASTVAGEMHTTPTPVAPPVDPDRLLEAVEHDLLALGKTLFDLREYRRSAAALDSAQSPRGRFLRLYATYLAGEKRKAEERAELPGWRDPENRSLAALRRELEAAANPSKDTRVLPPSTGNSARELPPALDGFGYYLLGVVLNDLGLAERAMGALRRAVALEPCFWGAWELLARLYGSRARPPRQVSLQDEAEMRSAAERHWIGKFFLARVAVERMEYDAALEVYEELERGFPGAAYLQAQRALVLYHLREFDEAQSVYEELREREPYRLEHIDNYSNILYVKEMVGALSDLANACLKVDKFRCETCCIVGNYHSLKGQHEQAINWFQRALTLNRRYLPAWTLLGHEYMELKNTGAAVEAYRQALDVDSSDHRAWYGLGQAYELLDLPLYTLYYYKRAVALRPKDARMWCAVGQCYEALKRSREAIACYQRAKDCNDVEGIAVRQLAILYRKLHQTDMAATYFELALARRDEQGLSGPETAEALHFLAQYAADRGDQDARAEELCTRLLDYAGPEKDLAKSLLRRLHTRKHGGSDSVAEDTRMTE